MTTTLNFKDYIDLPMWRPEAPALANSGAGQSFAYDMRNNETGCPLLYWLRSATAFDAYDPTTGEWIPLASPALAGTFGAGATAIFHPSQGPRGTIAAGASTTTLTLTTALPAAVGINQLANRGDGIGYHIHIAGNAAGSSGKVEGRTIIANTGGTTPTITLDAPLTFTPALGDAYEIRAGRVYLLSAGTLAAGVWKYYDIATNSFSASLSTTNLPATIGTDSSAIALSEGYVPNDRIAGEGFVDGAGTYDGAHECIVATASSSTTLTGSGMPATLQANEYRNFQVRIAEDTATPTAVNQRRRISSHTGGANGVFTVAAFAVTPSATAKFVIENDDDKILLTSSAGLFIYNYNITANTWDTSTWAAPVAHGAGVVLEQAFGITRDVSGNARHSFVYRVRGGASNAIDVLDIAGAATGSWSNDIAYGKKSQTFTTGTCGAYDPTTLGGRFLHLCVNGTQRMARFDLRNRIMDPESYLRFPQGAAAAGSKLAVGTLVDGATKLSLLYQMTQTQAQMFSMAVQR